MIKNIGSVPKPVHFGAQKTESVALESVNPDKLYFDNSGMVHKIVKMSMEGGSQIRTIYLKRFDGFGWQDYMPEGIRLEKFMSWFSTEPKSEGSQQKANWSLKILSSPDHQQSVTKFNLNLFPRINK